MKLIEIEEVVNAPGKNVYGTATVVVELGTLDKIKVQSARKKDEGGDWTRDNTERITLAEIAGRGTTVRIIAADIRETDKGDVILSPKNLALEWDSMVMLGNEALNALNRQHPPANQTGGSRRVSVPTGGGVVEHDDGIPV